MPGPIPVPVVPSLAQLQAERNRVAMLQSPLSPEAKAWGVTLTPAQVAPGQPYWRVERVEGPLDIGGNHHIFVDVVGEAGQRLTGIPVTFFWDDRTETKRTEAKPGDAWAVDLPMYSGGNAYGVRVDDVMPSDSLFGFGMPHFKPHHSFRVLFRRTVAGRDEGPTEPPAPPNLTERQRAFDDVLVALERLRRLL